MSLPENFKPLIGIESTTVDEKGRILVSKKKRERLGESCAILLGKSGGVIIYPTEVWERLFQEIFSVPTMNPGREQYTRLVLGNAEDEVPFDPQGRIVIPKRLREEGKLVDEVLVIGCGDRLEVWNSLEWEKFQYAPDRYNPGRQQAIDAAYAAMTGRSA